MLRTPYLDQKYSETPENRNFRSKRRTKISPMHSVPVLLQMSLLKIFTVFENSKYSTLQKGGLPSKFSLVLCFKVMLWQAQTKNSFPWSVISRGFCIKGFFSSFFFCPQNLKVTEYRIVEIDRIVRTPKSDRIPKSNVDGIMDP